MQMGIDRLRWVHIDAWAKREAKTRQKAPKVGEQEVLLSCLMTARKDRKLAGIVWVVREDRGEEWGGTKRRAV